LLAFWKKIRIKQKTLKIKKRENKKKLKFGMTSIHFRHAPLGITV